MGKEFRNQKVQYRSQPVVQIFYKCKSLDKTYQPDFVCYEKVIVESKTLSSISGTEEAQFINYLKATGLKVDLLINFGTKLLDFPQFHTEKFDIISSLRVYGRNERK